MSCLVVPFFSKQPSHQRSRSKIQIKRKGGNLSKEKRKRSGGPFFALLVYVVKAK